MKVRYTLETPWPSDVRNPQRFEACEWQLLGETPFLPVAGMFIACGAESDYLRVKEVYWSADNPDLVEVYFDEPSDERDLPASYWLRQGWSTKDFKVTSKLKGAQNA